MAAAGIVGTFCVVSVNAWMNNPTGFTIRDGVVTDVDPLAAMFSDLSWLQFAHLWVGNDAAGAKTTLAALVVVIALAVVIVLPALAYLLLLTQTEKWSRA